MTLHNYLALISHVLHRHWVVLDEDTRYELFSASVGRVESRVVLDASSNAAIGISMFGISSPSSAMTTSPVIQGLLPLITIITNPMGAW